MKTSVRLEFSRQSILDKRSTSSSTRCSITWSLETFLNNILCNMKNWLQSNYICSTITYLFYFGDGVIFGCNRPSLIPIRKTQNEKYIQISLVNFSFSMINWMPSCKDSWMARWIHWRFLICSLWLIENTVWYVPSFLNLIFQIEEHSIGYRQIERVAVLWQEQHPRLTWYASPNLFELPSLGSNLFGTRRIQKVFELLYTSDWRYFLHQEASSNRTELLQ